MYIEMERSRRMLRTQYSGFKLSQSSHSFEARSDEVKGYKTRNITRKITVNDVGIFPTLEIHKAANLIHYYHYWRQYVESSREATFYCCPKLITILMLFKTQYCL